MKCTGKELLREKRKQKKRRERERGEINEGQLWRKYEHNYWENRKQKKKTKKEKEERLVRDRYEVYMYRISGEIIEKKQEVIQMIKCEIKGRKKWTILYSYITKAAKE